MSVWHTDFELLSAYSRQGDQQAFATVSRRHLDLVYATAIRKVTDGGAAEEICQNVFVALASKAWRFAPDDSLPSWLYRTTLLESKSWLRGELRRRRREQTAAELGTTMKTPDEKPAFNALVPLLDEALLSLREKDRTALLLRYYENQPLCDMGKSLGVGEDGARKRVASALEKLSQFFQKRGFRTATVAAAAAALQYTAVSAPAAAASTVMKIALHTTPPTLVGLVGFLALANLTRMQKATLFLIATTALVAWLWHGNPKAQEAGSPTQTEARQVSAPHQSQHLDASEKFVQADDAAPATAQDAESAGTQRYVEITGEFEVTSFLGGETNDGTTVRPPWTISFVCITGTKEWRIEHDYNTGGESKLCFDGTNVYGSLRGIGSMNPTINIWERRDGHPLGDSSVNIPWLAFCSGTFLKREGRLIPLPDETLQNTPDRFAYSDKTETFDDELGLPRTVDLFTSKSLYQASADDFYQDSPRRDQISEHTKRVVSSLEEGVLTFHYGVTKSTNFFGWNLPTEFEYFQRERKYLQNADWFHRGVGKVKSIRLSDKPGNPFVPGMMQTIVDWRFRDPVSEVNALTYTSTNSFAAPTNDPTLQEKFAKKVERVKRTP